MAGTSAAPAARHDIFYNDRRLSAGIVQQGTGNAARDLYNGKPPLSYFTALETRTGLSRSREAAYKLMGAHSNIVEVKPMDRDAALALLQKKLGPPGRTRAQQRVCGAGGRRDGLSLWHGSVRVSYSRLLHCISKLHDSCVGS